MPQFRRVADLPAAQVRTTDLLVFDGNNLLIRAIKAMERSGLSADNISTGALMAFITSVARYYRAEGPVRMVVCWDGGRSPQRLAIFPEYKARRAPHEGNDEPESAFGLAKTFLSLSGVPQVTVAGQEADDLVAGLWRANLNDSTMVIVSGDKDFFQLLDDGVTQVIPGTDDRWDKARVIESMGCTPEQIPLVMALTGDAIDDIPGVPGYGTKTAVKVLARHDWNLHIAALKEPKLNDYWRWIFRNRKLVDLRADGPLIGWPQPLVLDTGSDDLLAFLHRYQLRLIEERLSSGALWGGPPS